MKITTGPFPAATLGGGVGGGGGAAGPAGGDLGGGYPSPQVTGLDGKPFYAPGTEADQNIIQYDAASGTWKFVAPPSTTPTGPAGGDLSGTYPNPSVAKINGSPLGTTTGAASGDVLTWSGSAWAHAALPAATVYVPLMATDDGGAHWYVVVDGSGTAVMVAS